MSQNMIMEIVENAYFAPEIHGKHGLRAPFRARPAGGGQMEQDQPQIMMGETETAQQPIFRHREVAAIAISPVKGHGEVLAPRPGPVTAGIHPFLKDREKTRDLGRAGVPQAITRHLQRRHIGGHGGVWHYLVLAAVKQGRKSGGTGRERDKTGRQGRRHDGGAAQ